MIAELVRHPHGRLADRIAARANCTSIIVAAELRYGAVRKASVRLAAQLEGVVDSHRCTRARNTGGQRLR